MQTVSSPPVKRARRGVFTFLGLLLVLGITAVVIGHGHAGAADIKPSATHAALTVTAAPVTVASWPQTLEASGPIAAWQEAIIGSEISGQRLIDVNVNVGDRVKKGEVLARFNPDILRAQQAQSLATWRQAESDHTRAESLKGSGAISDQQIETYANQAATDLAQLNEKNLQLRYAAVVAPQDGVISSRTATLGAIASAGGELFRLIVDNRLEWRGALNAEQLAQAKEGQEVSLTLPDGTTAKAKIRQFSPALDSNTRLGIAYADIVSGSHARAGMYANGTIMMETQNALVVPAPAVVIRDGHPYVFVLAEAATEPKVSMRQVKTGRTRGDGIEILSGIKEGERVAVQGAGFLNEGDTVRIAEQTADMPGEPK
jgi:RND family efflux transporter MFP subunit